MLRKIQDEGDAGGNGDDAAIAGGTAGAEVSERVKKKSVTTAAAGRKRKQDRPSMVPESSRGKKLQLKSQEMGEGGDLLDTSEEIIDEEFEPVGEGHSTNPSLEERNEKVLKEVVREVQGVEGETGTTLEESEEESKLLTIRYQGEEKKVYTFDPHIFLISTAL